MVGSTRSDRLRGSHRAARREPPPGVRGGVPRALGNTKASSPIGTERTTLRGASSCPAHAARRTRDEHLRGHSSRDTTRVHHAGESIRRVASRPCCSASSIGTRSETHAPWRLLGVCYHAAISYVGCPLAAARPATVPDDHAHWKLNPPSLP